MDFGDFLKKMLGEEKDRKEILVGKLSQEMSSKVTQLDLKIELEKKIIAQKINLYKMQLLQEHNIIGLSESLDAAWNEAYDYLGLSEEDRDFHYSIDRDTREVFKYVNEEEEEEEILKSLKNFN